MLAEINRRIRRHLPFDKKGFTTGSMVKFIISTPLHPKLTNRIWAHKKYPPWTTLVPKDHYSFVSSSWDAILEFFFPRKKRSRYFTTFQNQIGKNC